MSFGAGRILSAMMIFAVTLAVSAEEIEPIAERIHVTGNIIAHKTADLTPAVMGVVEKVHVDVGDRVRKGQALLMVRQDELQNQLERAQFALELAHAELRHAEEELGWGKNLRQSQAISEEQMRDITTQHEVTRARVGIAEAEVKEARRLLAETVIKAPFDGVITERNVDEGAYFSMMRGMGSGGALQIQKIDIVIASIFVPERYLNEIAVGTTAIVHIPALGRTIESAVNVINDRIDLKTRTIDVRVPVPNPDYTIKTNLFCSVDLVPAPQIARD